MVEVDKESFCLSESLECGIQPRPKTCWVGNRVCQDSCLPAGCVVGCVLNSCSSGSYTLIKRAVFLLIHPVAEVTAKNKGKKSMESNVLVVFW